MLKKILVGMALIMCVLLAIGLYLFRQVSSELKRESIEALEKLEPRVIAGAGQFEKRTFYAGKDLGEVTEILTGWPADREAAFLIVVGNEGADFLDESGEVKKQIGFSKRVFCPIEVVKLGANGDYGFLTRDQSWATDVILFNNRGEELWSYGGILGGIDDSAAGDVRGDGRSEVVVGHNGSGGLVLLDDAGKKIWRQMDGNVWHVEILDTSGHHEILHSNARGQLLVRNEKGEVIGHYLTGHYVSHFSLVRWGGESQTGHILIPLKESSTGSRKPVILVLDATGKTVAEFDAPFGDLMNRANGVPVRFAKQAEYYAVLQSRDVSKRSMLILYGRNAQIAYQEVIGDSCSGLAALPGKIIDRLLIGCTNKIWEYSPAGGGDALQTRRDSLPR